MSEIKQPLIFSTDQYWPELTTFGSTDQGGFNRLKQLVKTGHGFNRPALPYSYTCFKVSKYGSLKESIRCLIVKYRKSPKNSDTQKIAVITLKFE